MSTLPLAERMRPTSLDGYTGQSHLVGKGAVLWESITRGMIPSIILWGPPGVGKTTLAGIMAQQLNRPFFVLSAINSGVKEVREVIEKAAKYAKENPEAANVILFIDEIHRFSKSQQDSLLGAVEKGVITLIGATTENPSFEVIAPLLSRCQVYILKELTKEELLHILELAMTQDVILKTKKIVLKEYEALLRLSGGDARKLLNLFELVVNAMDGASEISISNDLVLKYAQQKMALYDKAGEQHYDIISAFIKSIRGSDPNGALYWLARMIKGGEDPKFIARRLLILSSEDIGNANPTALIMANNCFQAVQVIGYPECQIILSQTVTYLATSAKSNAAYEAIMLANQLVNQTGDLGVPIHLRNAPTKLMKELGYGKEYAYSHSHANNFSAQEYLPEGLSGKKIFTPGNNAREKEMQAFLKSLWKDKYQY
jgi:putative ATPase